MDVRSSTRPQSEWDSLVRRRANGHSLRSFALVEQQLIEFNQIALRRPDFKKTEDMFNRVMTRDDIAVVALLEHRKTGARLIVANVHIYWNPEFKDVKLVQAAMLMDELEKISDRFAKLPPRLDVTDPPTYGRGNRVPTIICGDYNSVPGSGIYEYMTKGTLSAKHEDFGDHVYGNYTSEGLRHSFGLKSAYSAIGELPFTNYTPGFSGPIDYIWYNADALSVTGVLGEIDKQYLSKVVGFPNAVSLLYWAAASAEHTVCSTTPPTTSPSSPSSGIKRTGLWPTAGSCTLSHLIASCENASAIVLGCPRPATLPPAYDQIRHVCFLLMRQHSQLYPPSGNQRCVCRPACLQSRPCCRGRV